VLLRLDLAELPDERCRGCCAQSDHNSRPTIDVRALNGRRRA
jgi:hypothetical protein